MKRHRTDSEWQTQPRTDSQGYAQLADAMTDAAFVIDLHGRFLEANRAAIETYGYSREELLTMGPADLDLHPDQKLVAQTTRELRSAKRRVFEAVHQTKAGRVFPVEIGVSYTVYEGQKAFLSLVRDISERKHAEDALRALGERHQAMLETVPEIIAEVDQNKVYTWVNAAGLRFFGEDVVGKEADEYFLGEQETYAIVQPLFDGDSDLTYVESWQRRHDGERRLLAWWCRSLRDDEGRVTGALSTARDITEHWQLQSALLESDAQNRHLFDSAPDAVFLSEPGSHFLDCNQTAVDRYGYSRDELLKMTHKDLAAPDLRASAGSHVDDTIGLEGTVFEWRHRRKDGTELPVEIRTVPFVTQGHRRILATVRDLTDSKLIEEALRGREREFQTLFESAPVGIGVADTQGKILAFNEAILTPGGYDRDDIECIGNVANLYYDESERDAALSLFADHGSLRQHETRFRRKDGTPYDVWLSLSNTTFGGEPCVLAIVEDRTEKRLADEALHQSEERFRTLSSVATEGIMIHEDGLILDANRAFADLAGVADVEELMGKRGLEVIPLTNESRDLIRMHMHTPSSDRYEVELVGSDGSQVWAETWSRPITYRGRPASLVFLRDMTASKRARLEQDRLQTQLRQAAKMESIGRLAGGVAHDFNNMLAVILGHVDLALEQVDPKKPLYSDLQEIRKAADRSASITQQLLAFARRQVTAPKRLDLNEAVENMLAMLRRLIGEQIELVWSPSVVHPVEIDPSQLDQVLVNLCLNSRDAIADVGKVTIVTSNVTLDQDYCDTHDGCLPGDYVLLSVSDDGTGMSEDALRHLFEPFYTTKDTGKGTGLGLATVYGIVKQNNGFIQVESDAEMGTDVRIYFPRAAGDVSADTQQNPGAALPGGKETLLVIEDEPAVLHLTERILSDLDYNVLTSRTPSEALRLAQRHKGQIALLVTDLVMPDMNGWELSERLLHLRPELKILYVSGYADDRIANKDPRAEGIELLQKPFTPQQLATRVRKVLDQA